MSTLENVSALPCFFVLSSGRSGSTLLRSMLACHGEISIPRPSHFIVEFLYRYGNADFRDEAVRDRILDHLLGHERVAEYGLDFGVVKGRVAREAQPTLATFFRVVFECHALALGKRIWGDRTTPYANYARKICRLFPDAKIVHLVRDGRDVALSLVSNKFSGNLTSALASWHDVEMEILACKRRIAKEQYYCIRFEDIVATPEAALKGVCAFLGVRYESRMLDYSSRLEDLLTAQERSIHRKLAEKPIAAEAAKWTTKLSYIEKRRSSIVSGRLLARHGYEIEPKSWSIRAHLEFKAALMRLQLARMRQHLRYRGMRVPWIAKAPIRAILAHGHPERLAACFAQAAEPKEIETHIAAAMAWLCRAQDDGPDDGVARSATIGLRRFEHSYPETTGYIIPTFLARYRETGDADLLRRARAMGEWEIEIQMKSGAVQGGTGRWHPRPAVFNTGQVMLGWNALYRETGERQFAEAAIRGARWLLSIQDSDGNWRRGHSAHAAVPEPTYNTRVAWPLAETGFLLQEQSFIEGARKLGRFMAHRQRANGWFEQCCLTDSNRPLTHTLAYATRGFLELGAVLNEESFIDVARLAATSLARSVSADGFLPGRLDQDWRAAAKWCCLTGSAQSAVIFWRLEQLDVTVEFIDAARRINDYLMWRHPISHSDDRIRGGVYGSWPINGPYGQFEVLNWATKFFVDSLMAQGAFQHRESGETPEIAEPGGL